MVITTLERERAQRERGRGAEQITQGQSLCLSLSGVCGKKPLFKCAEEKRNVSHFPLFSYFQILLLLPCVIQHDPLEIAKRLAWQQDDSADRLPRWCTNSKARCCNYNNAPHCSDM